MLLLELLTLAWRAYFTPQFQREMPRFIVAFPRLCLTSSGTKSSTRNGILFTYFVSHCASCFYEIPSRYPDIQFADPRISAGSVTCIVFHGVVIRVIHAAEIRQTSRRPQSLTTQYLRQSSHTEQ